jgi:hypothetical protein
MNEETKLTLLLRVALATAFTCVAVKWMVDQLDPTRDKKNKAKQQAQALMTKLRIKTNIQVNSIVSQKFMFTIYGTLIYTIILHLINVDAAK